MVTSDWSVPVGAPGLVLAEPLPEPVPPFPLPVPVPSPEPWLSPEPGSLPSPSPAGGSGGFGVVLSAPSSTGTDPCEYTAGSDASCAAFTTLKEPTPISTVAPSSPVRCALPSAKVSFANKFASPAKYKLKTPSLPSCR